MKFVTFRTLKINVTLRKKLLNVANCFYLTNLEQIRKKILTSQKIEEKKKGGKYGNLKFFFNGQIFMAKKKRVCVLERKNGSNTLLVINFLS